MSLIKFLTSKVFFKQLAIAVVAIVVLCFLVLKWLDVTTNHGEFVIVPDLKGKSIETVGIELKDHDLAMEIQDSANYNPNYPKYSVIEQNPIAGSQVKENRKIYLILNPSGYRKVEVPNILKRTFRQAKPQLEALEFQIGEISYKKSIGEGVLSMSHNGKPLKPGTLLPLTSKIDLVIGKVD
ncbi:PASTA domain-containing protein [Winogradskyella eximia]|jgi:eukaryotic-like serine/threonine-protein kinase|uniref:PASTA domain-containing protein n=1 Tax=Winogradskyella eximia TaxID=262006 RepID=A0A3D9HCW4_9FLAO|nr:PASTA domain-containing protein [Winogradskyella eximia]RED47322.1 PASTA domain-containing protein [Winogradskyella eximia]|tara:strand:- start:25092 stop:25637 length:546 start_codon:yes stop_codon:yes gene_type:complete